MADFTVLDSEFEGRSITLNRKALYEGNTFTNCTIYADCNDVALRKFKETNTLIDCEIVRGRDPDVPRGTFKL